MPPQPGAPPPPAFLKSLGTVGVAVVEEPGRSRLEAVVLASTEEARSQFRRSAKLGSVRESTLAYFPETTLAVYLYHNLGGYWATMKENLKTMLPPQEAQKFESELMNPPALAGFDWQALVSELTGETGVALVNVEEKKAQVLVVAEAQEAPALTKSLQQLQKSLERVGFSWKKQEYQGTTLTVAAHPTFREAPVPLSPCYAQVDRTLLVASDAATLRAALDTAKGRGKSLREAPLYQTIRAQLPKQTQGLLFVDLRFLDRLFKQFAQAPEAGQVMAVLQSLGLNQVKAVGGGATLTENRGKQTLLVEGGNALHALVAPAAPVAAVLFPVFDQAREKARTAACQSNLKQIGLAALMLESDQGRLPDHRRLEQELQPYLRNPQVFQCPSARPGAPPYRMNSRVSRKALKQIAAPADTILAFESDEQGQPIFRHNDGINLLFVDGHVKWMKRGTLRDGQWTPQAGD
jgi:prepilin-type processing-associated H-X9-DG protein